MIKKIFFYPGGPIRLVVNLPLCSVMTRRQLIRHLILLYQATFVMRWLRTCYVLLLYDVVYCSLI